MYPFYEWFRWLYDATGINLTYIYDPFDRMRMLRGLELTIKLAAITIALSICVGVFGAWAQTSRSVCLRLSVNGFINLFRNTPPLVQIYFFYFGLGYLLPRVTDASGQPTPLLSNFQWAVVSLSLFVGALNIEVFRSGIQAVASGIVEACEALGLTRRQAYWKVVLPLAARICLPALGNNLVELLKATNLSYAIGVPELMYTAKQIWSDSSNVPEMMITVLIVYVFLTTLLAWFIRRVEHWLKIPGFGKEDL